MIECMFTQNRCMTTKKQAITPVGIIVHSSGANNPNLSRYVAPSDNDPNYDYIRNIIGVNKYGNHHNRTASSKALHYYVGKIKVGVVDVCHTLPHNVACWGCGEGKNGSYNYSPVGHIQIEVCEDDLSSADYFNGIYEAVVKLCAKICIDEGLDETSIISHKEAHARGYASNHRDIDHWLTKFGKNMNILRKDVEDEVKRNTKETVNIEGVISINDKEYEFSGTAREC